MADEIFMVANVNRFLLLVNRSQIERGRLARRKISDKQTIYNSVEEAARLKDEAFKDLHLGFASAIRQSLHPSQKIVRPDPAKVRLQSILSYHVRTWRRSGGYAYLCVYMFWCMILCVYVLMCVCVYVQ